MPVIYVDNISHIELNKEGREDVNDDARSGRPSASTRDENIEACMKIDLDSRRITIREVADDVGI